MVGPCNPNLLSVFRVLGNMKHFIFRTICEKKLLIKLLSQKQKGLSIVIRTKYKEAHALPGSDCMPTKNDCRDHSCLAATPPPKGQVLFSTALPQPQRAQKLHMYGLYADACDVG